VKLPHNINSSFDLDHYASEGLKRIFKEGYAYKISRSYCIGLKEDIYYQTGDTIKTEVRAKSEDVRGIPTKTFYGPNTTPPKG